ncbi:MAG: sulfatase-like hydrolase/transferase, partial [Planctomycetota bacterium]|nr:sulfatase-like hydrolase/transferase [Planctomycetota bacterium]
MSAQEYADRYLVETAGRFLRRKSISKDFLKTIITLLLGLGVSLFAEATKPNIVVIISDDQAWTDYGFMGHPTIKTPHLDRLARRSL